MPQPAPNLAVRRFRLVWTVSLAVKIAALFGLLLFVTLVLGGIA
ncbi:MAG TPA: hypothetical protein VMC82_06035 [Thermoplasmata archaeon]|nr:hypothetical protein [Thermoplasmata archaeon]